MSATGRHLLSGRKKAPLAYFEELPWDKVAEEIGVALRTVHKIKNQALDQLVEMYQFTDSFS